jgi:hypothetical protein
LVAHKCILTPDCALSLNNSQDDSIVCLISVYSIFYDPLVVQCLDFWDKH